MLPDYRVRQRNLLLEISRSLTKRLDLTEVLRGILEASASMLGGEIGLIALRDHYDRLIIKAAFGVEAEQLAFFDDLLADIQEVGLDPERLNLRTKQIARRLQLPLRQVIALPMVMSDEVLGLILVFHTFTGSVTSNDRQILQSFADQAAIAVHNARLYEAVTNEKKRLSAILESSADGIMILDDEQRILRFNQSLGKMTGWRTEMALGRIYTDVVRWNSRKPGPSLDDMLHEDWETGHTLYMEGELERLDGFSISVAIIFALLRREDGQPGNVVANVRDITNYRKAEEMKNNFISIVSHELKTPVALIKGYASTMLRDDADWAQADYQEALKVIEDEADRLTELIENLLTASKLQGDGMRLNWADIHLEDVARRSAERFQKQTQQHEILLDFPIDLPLVRGDESWLRKVVDNLISNAIKYSPQGGEIILRGAYDDANVALSVQDSGIGLRSDQLEKVFERFYRVDDALTRSTQGTGLGLYLSRAIVDAHGGHVWAESQHGQGTTFTFTLPR